MDLETQILQRSKEISTDAYAMSVGEMISLYKEGELDIHPEFQRFFRWTPAQKSRLIESLLLGIPIPSLFVSQKPDGTWDAIDGLQRLSTILQLTGDLRDADGNAVGPLILEKTRYLPGLEGRVWQAPEGRADFELPQSAKLKIKRARLDLKIVLNTSDPSAKYELFERLNTGGSIATDQEVRNCLLIMINKPFYTWFAKLGDDKGFSDTVPLSERAVEERYDLELVVRFLVFRSLPHDATVGDLGKFLTDKIVEFAESKTYDPQQEEKAFRRTFSLLVEALGDDAFRKYDPEKGRALGPVLISVFEVMALGIGHYAHKSSYKPTSERIRRVHQELWTNKDFQAATGSGIRASTRIPVTLRLGRELFAP